MQQVYLSLNEKEQKQFKSELDGYIKKYFQIGKLKVLGMLNKYKDMVQKRTEKLSKQSTPRCKREFFALNKNQGW